MKPKIIQVQHPLTKRYMKLSTATGRAIAEKRGSKPYRHIPIRAIDFMAGAEKARI